MKDWRSALVHADTPLRSIIASLNDTALGICLVTNDDGQLLGTITDGDIRRSLIKNFDLNSPAIDVMAKNPKVAQQSFTVDQKISLMERNGISQIPIVDKDLKIIGLQTLHSLLDDRILANPVFIMAGGYGSRLMPLTENCPKPMLKVGTKPILETIIENFFKSGFRRFFISTHYRSDVIKNYFGDGSSWGIDIDYTYEETPLGTAGALSLLPIEEINLPVIVSNGDLLTTLDYLSFLRHHNDHPAVATMCVRQFEYRIPYGVIRNVGRVLTGIEEKPSLKFFINAGIYVISPELIQGIPKNTHLDMTDMLGQVVADDRVVNIFPIHENWLDVGHFDDFQKAQSEVAIYTK